MQRIWLVVSMLVVAVACSEANLDPVVESAAGSGSTGPSTGSGSSGGLPCEVEEVLATHCQGCHSDPPSFGAPMPLVSLADITAAAVSDPSRTVAELIPERLDDPKSPMPPSGDMTAAERATLLDWLGQGTPANQGSDCEPPEVETPDVGPEALDCEVTHTFTAHADGDEAAPFHVPEIGAGNLYQCFTFKSPFAEVTTGTAWAPIVDDERVLHHWILYRTKTPQPDGGVMPCQMPSDATFVSGWAPGGLNFETPEDVAFELGGPDDYFILQVHYHNVAQYDDALDASGVALCTSKTPPKHVAGVVTLGTVWIDIPPMSKGTEASGLCPAWATSFLQEPLYALASFPHMHELGTVFRTDIHRGGNEGPAENLVTVDPWVFDDQRFYAHDPPVVIQPGDALRTTCRFDNPYSFNVGFGEETEDEMCFNFVMVYPIDAVGDSRQCGIF